MQVLKLKTNLHRWISQSQLGRNGILKQQLKVLVIFLVLIPYHNGNNVIFIQTQKKIILLMYALPSILFLHKGVAMASTRGRAELFLNTSGLCSYLLLLN